MTVLAFWKFVFLSYIISWVTAHGFCANERANTVLVHIGGFHRTVLFVNVPVNSITIHFSKHEACVVREVYLPIFDCFDRRWSTTENTWAREKLYTKYYGNWINFCIKKLSSDLYRLLAPYSLITTPQIFGLWWLSEPWIVIANK